MVKSTEISELIYNKIISNFEKLSESYSSSKRNIGYFFLDDLLPEEIAHSCFVNFPSPLEMRELKSIREHKYVSAQMDEHNPILEEVIYAFQADKVVNLIGEICKINSLEGDKSLYAGGLSLMGENNFLNPHLDNSHDAKRKRWRVLNLLYYVTPEWGIDNGGHLELWINGPKKEPIVIESKFNRLVVMATHAYSWHSVSKVEVNKNRCCISNYYFSDNSLRETDKFHVTKFKGRPNDTLKNIILDFDANLRMFLRKIFKKGIRKNPHRYKKKNN